MLVTGLHVSSSAEEAPPPYEEKPKEYTLPVIKETMDGLNKVVTRIYADYSWELVPDFPEASFAGALNACYQATPLDPNDPFPGENWTNWNPEGAPGDEADETGANFMQTLGPTMKKGNLEDLSVGRQFWMYMNDPKAMEKLTRPDGTGDGKG